MKNELTLISKESGDKVEFCENEIKVVDDNTQNEKGNFAISMQKIIIEGWEEELDFDGNEYFVTFKKCFTSWGKKKMIVVKYKSKKFENCVEKLALILEMIEYIGLFKFRYVRAKYDKEHGIENKCFPETAYETFEIKNYVEPKALKRKGQNAT